MRPSVVHVVVTENFAGVERYVCGVSAEEARRGWRTTVIGGDPERMPVEAGPDVRWLPGGTASRALRSLWMIRREPAFDICHVHMTMAEAIGMVTRRWHGGRLVATRHFARPRGSTPAGRLLALAIERSISTQIAISEFVDSRLEKPADVVLLNGTPASSRLWSAQSKTVLVLQRLESEKSTETALLAWQASDLARRGWTMRIAGRGSDGPRLQALARTLHLDAIEFAGHVTDVHHEFSRAAMLLATAPAEPFGLSVVEAMAAGIPVVAAGGGGHLETIGRVSGAMLFRPGDHTEAGRRLVLLADSSNGIAAELSHAVWEHHQAFLSLRAHSDRLLEAYGKGRNATSDVKHLGVTRSLL